MTTRKHNLLNTAQLSNTRAKIEIYGVSTQTCAHKSLGTLKVPDRCSDLLSHNKIILKHSFSDRKMIENKDQHKQSTFQTNKSIMKPAGFCVQKQNLASVTDSRKKKKRARVSKMFCKTT